MYCYLDNSATTKTDDDVIDLMARIMREDYGNPSSRHMKGVEAERLLVKAREDIASLLKVREKSIVFTSGGTESDNLALIGAARAAARRGRHIITTQTEHDAVNEPLKLLSGEGFDVTYLPVDKKGHINLVDLKSAIRDDTVLVSVIYINNETGALQDIEGIGKLIKEANPSALFHTDAVQAFAKYRIYPSKMNIDLMSVSAHKIHGPKGAGFCYIGPGVKVLPQMLGGGQQRGMRSGTDNVPGACGTALAAVKAYARLEEDAERMSALKDLMIRGLEGLGERLKQQKSPVTISVNSARGAAGAPHIVSCSFYPVKGEVLLHALEERGIYVSSGSACSSNRRKISSVLTAMGLPREQAESTLRFSFCAATSQEEINFCLKALSELLPVLGKFVPR